MRIRYTDEQISEMITERKTLPRNYRSCLRLISKPGHKQATIEIKGESSNNYRIILRQSSENTLDFSVILGVQVPHSNKLFLLRRYNGKSHQHTNKLEGNTFFDYHIHEATERYQEFGESEEFFAQPTERYSSIDSALKALISDCGFVLPGNEQLELF